MCSSPECVVALQHLARLYASVFPCGVGAPIIGCPTPLPSLFHCFTSVTGACSVSLLRGGSWLGYQDLPAMGAVSIKELDANSGSSWMFQAPNLHFARQLLNTCILFTTLSTDIILIFPPLRTPNWKRGRGRPMATIVSTLKCDSRAGETSKLATIAHLTK